VVGWNVGEAGVGASEATDLASLTLAALTAALHKQTCYAQYLLYYKNAPVAAINNNIGVKIIPV